MTIPKPDDPYGIAAPPAWPEANEDALEALSQTFKNAASTVRAQAESAQREQTMMFDGAAPWSGGAAGAAHGVLGQRIADLQNLATKLQAAGDLLHDCSEAVGDAKKQISANVENANKDIGAVSGDKDVKDDDKKRYIQKKIQDTKNANISLIQAEAGFVSGKHPKPDPSHYEVKRDPDKPNNGAPTDNLIGGTYPGMRSVPASNTVGGGEPPPVNIPTTSTPGVPAPAPGMPVSNAVGGGEPPPVNMPTTPTPGVPAPAPGEPAPVPAVPAVPASNTIGAAERGPTNLPTTPQTGPNSVQPPQYGPPSAHGPIAPGPAHGVPAPGPSGAPGAPSMGSPGSPGGGRPSMGPQMMGNPGQGQPLTPQQQLNDFTKAMTDAAQQAAQNQPLAAPQTGGHGPSSTPVNPSAALQPPPSGPAAPVDSAPAASSSGGGSSSSAPPVNSNLNMTSGPTPGGMPLGPAPSLPTAGPPAQGGGAPGPMGPGVVPASTSSGASSSAAGPAPVPVTAARAERDAVAAAQTANALRRKQAGNDPLQLARRIAAALNAPPSVPQYAWGFVWATGMTTDGAILVANSYGIAYIPEEVNLPEQVRMVSADESISAADRAKSATFPFLALQDWAQHQGARLQAVIGTSKQLEGIDPGATKVVLDESDIPKDGRMQGRSRLEIIAPGAAAMLAATSDAALIELLPPRPADDTAPVDKTQSLWREVQKPLMRTTEGREVAHLQAFVNYANHQEELALHRAHLANTADLQRTAIADWAYWQHIGVLISDSLVEATPV
jgi:hypothetical protein